MNPPASSSSGRVYLVGAGPGDPGLLTVRARELIGACDVLVYDALVTAPILNLVNPAAERIYVGKRGNRHDAEQVDINAILVEQAKRGLTVVRLKGGDPYLFGRGAEEAFYLVERGVAVDVVPGVTAGIAAPAYAGIPVTHRAHASAVAFVTGHEDPAKPETALDYAALAKIGTLCFYMGVKNLGRIAAELSAHLPPDTPAAVIQWGTTPRQRTVAGTLADIEAKVRAAGLEAPALTVIGNVIKEREALDFFERRPLFGKRIVVTRSRAQASDLAAQLEALGAEVLRFPTIRIEPAEEPGALAAAVRRLGEFDWVVLTSVNGVDALFAELKRQERDARAFGPAKVAAVGSATAARLAEYGVRADLLPPKYVAESIVEALRAKGVFKDAPQEEQTPPALREALASDGAPPYAPPDARPVRFLLARADIARSTLPHLLRELGANVTEVVAYRTVLETSGQEEALAALEQGQVDTVTFTSASTARNFAGILGPERLKQALAAPRLKCLSIGPLTSAAMKELGLPNHGEAGEHDIPGLVDLILKSSS
ncbi:MAG: uroporphyrinogen-III C-methyltransferase [Planctomycetota bacterium]|nr:uroporphyrinogen-III C-methyltransferase [Planctomycetota bacterium]